MQQDTDTKMFLVKWLVNAKTEKEQTQNKNELPKFSLIMHLYSEIYVILI